MKMKNLFLVFCLIFSAQSFAQTYKAVPTITTRNTSSEVLEVKKLSSKVVVETGEHGNYENRSVEITLGIEAVASACEKVKDIEYLPSQSSLDSALNPSDFYLRVNTKWKKDCATGSYGKPEHLKLVLKYSIDQRPVSESGKPWSAPDFYANEQIHHLSFDSGMMGGYNRWKLYKLDYSDLNNVKFDYVKQYSYVQGQAIDQ